MSTTDPKQLNALAALLDCSPDAFTDRRQLPDDLGALHELFDLWLKIGSREGRSRLLALARELADANPQSGSEYTARPQPDH